MCLWVLIGHTCRQTGFSIPVLRSPNYAVDGFMVLSGFLMTYHAVLRAEKEPWTQPKTWFTFYIRRYFRISVLYYLLLIPAYLLADYFVRWRIAIDNALHISDRPLTIEQFTPLDALLHVTYLFGFFPRYHASTVLPDWSLSLEMQFYFLFPVFMLLAMRFGWLAFSLLASLVWLVSTRPALHFAQQFWQPSPLPLSLLWFVIGMLWANAYLKPNEKIRTRTILLGMALSLLSKDAHCILLVAVFAWIVFSDGRVSFGRLASLARGALSGRLSNFLARASYSVYLVHLLILTPTAYLVCTRLHLEPPLRFMCVLAVTVSISYGIAKPLEFLENWGVSLGKRLSGRLSFPVRMRYSPSGTMEPVPYETSSQITTERLA